LFSAVVLAIGSMNSASANLVVNGGFELYSGGFSQLGDSGTGGYTSLTAWTAGPGTSGTTFGVQLSTGIDDGPGAYSPLLSTSIQLHGPSNGSNNGLTGSADGGAYVALAGGATWKGNGISQTLSGLTPGESYDVGFEWALAQRFGFSGTYSGSLDVFFGSSNLSTSIAVVPSTGFGAWTPETFSFTAASSSEVLRFQANGTPDDLGPFVLLDGIFVIATTPPTPPAAVPEPGTVGLMACVVVGFGAFRLRRRVLAKAV
jgi:hypothetical protein